MGNSSGGLAEYWRLIRKERLLQGAFIWDWKDQGILRTKLTPQGERPFFAYGGDFGDFPNDDNFCFNGVVAADLTPNPHAAEVAHQYRNLLVSAVDLGADQPVLGVTNELFFTTLRDQPFRWRVTEDGREVLAGRAVLPECGPGQTVQWTAPLADLKSRTKGEALLTVEFLQGEAKPWAPASHVVATEQVILPWGKWTAAPSGTSAPPLRTQVDDYHHRTYVASDRLLAIFDDTTGRLISYRIDGYQRLVQPLQLNFWRPPTDNDRGNGMPKTCAVWKEAGSKAKATRRELTPQGDKIVVRYEIAVPAGESTAALEYHLFGSGRIEVSMDFVPQGVDLPVIPRVGMMCGLASEMSEWTWYGRGPGENYSDRKEGYPVGVYRGSVRSLWYPYSEPQETANRTDIRWASFTRADGVGIRVYAADENLLEVGAYPFAQDDLERVKHPVEIAERAEITLQISHRQMGVGGENSWGAWPRSDHVLKADRPYRYQFVIEPVSAR